MLPLDPRAVAVQIKALNEQLERLVLQVQILVPLRSTTILPSAVMLMMGAFPICDI